jgi:S-DNA-T family DNA segregation ATPase FtsK/SpoIIIE
MNWPGAGAAGVWSFWLLALAELFGAGPCLVHLRRAGRRAELGGASGRVAGRWQLFRAGFFGLVVRGGRGAGWLAALARWMRGRGAAPPAQGLLARYCAGRLAFWLGLALLLVASTALEWSRLYRLEALAAGPRRVARWAICLGRLSMQMAGFHRLGPGAIVALPCWALRWCSASPGAIWPSALAHGCTGDLAAKKREIAEDLAWASSAAREREEVVDVERKRSRSTTRCRC